MQSNALIRACDHRVCCNINTLSVPLARSPLSQSRAHPAPCTQEHVSVHVCERLQQIREKGGRTAPESACKCRSSLSQKQQLKAQIIYHHFIFFFPSFQENIFYRSTQIRVQPHSSCLWHFPNPPCLHMHLRTRPFRYPAARACHNTWERESRRKQMADGGKRILKPSFEESGLVRQFYKRRASYAVLWRALQFGVSTTCTTAELPPDEQSNVPKINSSKQVFCFLK